MDPLLQDGLDLGVVLFLVVKALIGFTFVLIGVILMVWFERKTISDIQYRIGPNRAGPWGVLQTLADGIKLIFKEDTRPDRASPLLFRLAPYLAVAPAFLTFTIVPIAGVFGDGEGQDGTITLFGHTTYAQVADPPIGILLLLALSSIAVYGVMLAGYSSGSKYPLLGSVRATASMISYEAALGLSVVAVILMSGSLSTHDIVAAQADRLFIDWNIVQTAIVPFFIFFVAATAELNRPPFDFAEAEQEIVAGFHTEYSSIRFGMFYLAEFMNVITMSAIIVTLFLGGPAGPIGPGPEQLYPPLWFLAKLVVFLFVFVWMRGTLPRFRYDQLMDLGWKRLIPAALVWLMFLATVQVGRDQGWDFWIAPAIGITLAGATFLLMSIGLRTSRLTHDEREKAGSLS